MKICPKCKNKVQDWQITNTGECSECRRKMVVGDYIKQKGKKW